MNNPVKTFVIQSSYNEYTLSLLIQGSVWGFQTPKLGMLLLGKLNILRGGYIGLRVRVEGKFWGAAGGGWHNKNVFNGWINLCSCNTHLSKLSHVLIHYIEYFQC